ncbi:hypothetical protein C8J57DRAFT_1134795 [Mycena rebaudengoi]|nr:hypothetical protein C8J57DRAFT_1134795 [Mycena rebaudengoi]
MSVSTVPPPYAASPPAPSYSPDPADSETTVEINRARSYIPAGNYTKHCRRETLILTGQDATAELPTYEGNCAVNGIVALEDREMISKVVLKIQSKMHVWISGRGSMDVNLVDDSLMLWSSNTSHTSACPSALAFSVRSPTKFQHEGITYPLPPSYDLPVNTVPGLIIKCSYSITLVVTRIRSRRLRFITGSSTMCVPFQYTVRARPWSVQPPMGDFFTEVKTMPAEWRQVVTEVLPRQLAHSAAQPIYIHLFLAAGSFGLQDAIPFHIQVTGPAASLNEFLPETKCALRNIQVTLVRQVALDLYGQKSRGTVVLGQTRLYCRPPGHGASCAHAADSEASLDFGGEVRCSANVAVGTFDAGVVAVQDFICIELRPFDSARSHFSSIRLTHRIKFVTDSWAAYDGQ